MTFRTFFLSANKFLSARVLFITLYACLLKLISMDRYIYHSTTVYN